MTITEKIHQAYEKTKYPLMYTAGFTVLSGMSQGAASLAKGLEQAVHDSTKTMLHNLPFFALVNTVYAQGVERSTKKWGRLGANIFCGLVNAAFYAYALSTSDNDPTLPCSINAAAGFYLTNKHVGGIKKPAE